MAVRREFRQRALSASSSLHDSGVRNRNGIFWLKHKEREALEMWELGKKFGVGFDGNDSIVIQKFMELEDRDEAVVMGGGCGNVNQLFR